MPPSSRPATPGTHLGAVKYKSHETAAKAKNFSLVVPIALDRILPSPLFQGAGTILGLLAE